jgi:Cullin binding
MHIAVRKLLCVPQVKPDLSNYDESQAWPLLLDNFVEWGRVRIFLLQTG